VVLTRALDELPSAAERALEGASYVVLCGGDGTYLSSVTALADAFRDAPLPPVVFARGGTVSVVAKNWCPDTDVIGVARRVAERPHSFRFVERPTLRVTAADGTGRVAFTFGTGLVANFFVEYERDGARGNRAAAVIAARAFVESILGGPYADRILSPLPCRITVDGAELSPQAWSLVVASVLEDVGIGMRVTHQAGTDPDRPHLVASPLPPRRLGPQWTRVVRGLPLRGDGNFDGLARSFRVDFPSDEGPFVLDGDTFHSAHVTVGAGPRLRVAL
jgi:diacylglycerol kinase family enzyme